MIKAENLSFRYDHFGGKEREKVLKNINLTVEKGDKILILGEPESGKTTLSMILSSLIPEFVEGELEGKVYPEGDMKDRMDKYTLVPQNSGEFILSETVEDEISFPLESLGIGREEMKERVEKALSFWGLEHLREASTSELSGGEKRRLMLSTSLVTEPDFVIYDESFDDLDVSWREVLKKHIETSGEASVVMASRFISYFDSLFNRIYLLENGELKEWKGEGAVIPRPEAVKGRKNNRLECRNITFTHPRRSSNTPPFVLEVDDFSLESGEVVALMGPNGSGKSTFSRLLCGLDDMDRGSIVIDGKECGKEDLGRSVGYMFQNPDYQIFLPTVKDELSYSLSFLKISEKEKEKRLEETASLFSLDLSDTASLMSYGERKRLQSAIYYSLDRPFYILDELDSALSYKESVSILQRLSEKGAGILLITHDEEFAAMVAERRYRAQEGRIYEE